MAETDVAKRRDPTHTIGPSTVEYVLAVSSPRSADERSLAVTPV